MKIYKLKSGTELQIMNIKGKDYLQVAQRVIWFREDMPSASVQTEIIKLESNSCLMKATIKNENGVVLSTSHKFENAAGFPDYIEKSETGAIGRALALIGFGTQFTGDDFNEGPRLADSPIQPNVEAKEQTNRTSRDNIPDTISGEFAEFSAPQFSAPEMGDMPSNGSYMCTFGKKHLNKTLDQIGVDDIKSYKKFLIESSAKKGEKLSGAAAEFCVQAEIYLANNN